MDSYYVNQATSLPHFSGHYRQRGSGFGALAAGIGRVALPLARRFNFAYSEAYWERAFETKCFRDFGCSRKQKIS